MDCIERFETTRLEDRKDRAQVCVCVDVRAWDAQTCESTDGAGSRCAAGSGLQEPAVCADSVIRGKNVSRCAYGLVSLSNVEPANRQRRSLTSQIGLDDNVVHCRQDKLYLTRVYKASQQEHRSVLWPPMQLPLFLFASDRAEIFCSPVAHVRCT